MQNNLFQSDEDALTCIADDHGEVLYQANFLAAPVADQLLASCLAELAFKQEPVRLFGKSIMQPRLTAWVADAGVQYTYSGLTSQQQDWITALSQLRLQLEQHLATQFNAVLGNYYRHGQDYMGWHSDDEKTLGEKPIIASISLGAERRFDIRRRKANSYQSIELAHGSLLVMRGDLQHYWQHRLPKQPRLDQARLNLTFRYIKQ